MGWQKKFYNTIFSLNETLLLILISTQDGVPLHAFIYAVNIVVQNYKNSWLKSLNFTDQKLILKSISKLTFF